ncbi:HNH endonuclease [Streptomyces phage Psst4]|uniref:HNH endonuclease n=3 Tax=Rimavirus drgrey TaxID=2560783 RepID=A0A649VX79_9CAUD|nr:HNH endonuclease [Streptomyces phage DrGrey]QAY17036.1 HNH endonuclease [Streptomyces phage Popy]QGJ96542.1 HNH endonuclease [Streptomyces phage FrodoSwaggins]WPJ30617.1 HNH endonuclease [Streptomyces phage Psst1]WPJ30830.1 HNH endonuclease [Streptomyces phage Psst4]ASU03916.1 HNH endonuclease [Streptomyces phage DrGrey]
MNRSYRELRKLTTFVERFRYLALRGNVGQATFGFDRWVNQGFYTSREWRQARDRIIVRDEGCDLGIEGYEIHDRVYIHHINPITLQQLESGDPCLVDPDNLITVTHRTHNAIHYGDERLLPRPLVARQPGDTKLW